MMEFYIEEKKYQKMKEQIHKENDYFTEREVKELRQNYAKTKNKEL